MKVFLPLKFPLRAIAFIAGSATFVPGGIIFSLGSVHEPVSETWIYALAIGIGTALFTFWLSTKIPDVIGTKPLRSPKPEPDENRKYMRLVADAKKGGS
jgi:hypothetical protein